MLQGWILVDHTGTEEEQLRRISLQNAKQLVVGSIPGQIIVHVAATTAEDMNRALMAFSKVPAVTSTTLLILRTR